MPGMGFGFGFGFHRRASGSGASASEQLLTLATNDGWHALFDVSNPDTRTLRDDGGDQYLSALADGLGNLPDYEQSTAARQPLFVIGAFGQLDGVEFDAAASQFLATGAFTALTQPVFRISVVRDDETGSDSRTPVHNVDSGERTGLITTGASRTLNMQCSSTVSTGLDVGNAPAIIAGFFNGASSVGYVNSAASSTIDPGTESCGALHMGRPVANTAFWNGRIAIDLIFNGDPGATKRQRMFDKLHDLTGIAKA